MSKSYIGFYSHEACKVAGYAVYANEHGFNVAITEIAEEDRLPFSEWRDLQPVGKVSEFIASFDRNGNEEK